MGNTARRVPGIFTLLAASLLLAGCAPTPIAYSNPGLGLELTHPSDWEAVGAIEKEQAQEGAEKLGLKASGEEVKAALDKLAFGIHKPFRFEYGHDNANLMVLAMPVDAATCAALNDGSFEAQDAVDYPQTIPGARPATSKHVRIPGLHGFSVQFTLRKIHFLQHRYWYCFHDQGVVIQSSTATPAAEAEMGQILASIRVAGR